MNEQKAQGVELSSRIESHSMHCSVYPHGVSGCTCGAMFRALFPKDEPWSDRHTRVLVETILAGSDPGATGRQWIQKAWEARTIPGVPGLGNNDSWVGSQEVAGGGEAGAESLPVVPDRDDVGWQLVQGPDGGWDIRSPGYWWNSANFCWQRRSERYDKFYPLSYPEAVAATRNLNFKPPPDAPSIPTPVALNAASIDRTVEKCQPAAESAFSSNIWTWAWEARRLLSIQHDLLAFGPRIPTAQECAHLILKHRIPDLKSSGIGRYCDGIRRQLLETYPGGAA
jgi:hypothetical protein